MNYKFFSAHLVVCSGTGCENGHLETFERFWRRDEYPWTRFHGRVSILFAKKTNVVLSILRVSGLR